MSEPLSAARPDFFGKDSFVPFIGVVDDVDDPKHSGRVKVRCVGWHPIDRKGAGNGDDSLPTEDLPWARVGMPVTHAQQSRIGGKHGLLPGCWVFGFFLDGEEAQDPFVVSTFNFTSKTSDTDNRKNVAGDKGTLSEEAEGFDKVLTAPAQQPNTSLRTTKEKQQQGFSDPADVAGDNVNNDSDNDKCGGKAELESAASKAAKEEFRNPENPSGQNYNVTEADGRCGSNAHQSEDIKLKMKERMPSQHNRFNYGDVVWERFQGNFMDLNGILAQLSLELCALLKQNIESRKQEQEEQLFRNTKPSELKAIPGRNPRARILKDEEQRRKSDIFHVGVAAIIDQLCMLIMTLLQQQQNGGSGGTDNNNRGNRIGALPITNINDPAADCVAETFENNFYLLTQKGIEDAATLAITTVDDAIRAELDTNNDTQGDGGGSSLDENVNQILSALGMVTSMGSGMIFPTTDKYTEKTQIHNSQGDKSQDKKTRQGCKETRQYNTEMGSQGAAGFISAMASVAAGAAASGGGEGGSAGGSVSRDSTDLEVRISWAKSKAGGKANNFPNDINYATCEDGATTKYPDPGYDGVRPGQESPRTEGDYDIQPTPGDTSPTTPLSPQVLASTTVEPESATTNSTTNPGVNDTSPIPSGVIIPGLNTVPTGYNAVLMAISMPSSSEQAALNFIDGTPNAIAVCNPGRQYYYHNDIDPTRVFPSIYIPGYNGTPIPVINRQTGEFVAVLSIPVSWNPNYPMAPISALPDNSRVGILSDDPEYDIVLGGFHIENTGFNYCNPRIKLWDRDKATYDNGEVEAVVQDGRIVEIVIINSGSGWKRIPTIEIYDDCRGYGARICPIMNVVPVFDSKERSAPVSVTEAIFCPAKNQINSISALDRDPVEKMNKIIVSAMPTP